VFDTVFGLPVHVLVLHLTVVLVPVVALATVGVALVGRVRDKGAWPVVALNVVSVAAVFVSIQSGQELQYRLRQLPQELIQKHADLGDAMLWFALALLAVSVLVALTRHQRGTVTIALGVLSVVAAVAATVWIVRVGHSGAEAVWKNIVIATNPSAG
jgi:hypothetical protein